jgi:hypothetical protein
MGCHTNRVLHPLPVCFNLGDISGNETQVGGLENGHWEHWTSLKYDVFSSVDRASLMIEAGLSEGGWMDARAILSLLWREAFVVLPASVVLLGTDTS